MSKMTGYKNEDRFREKGDWPAFDLFGIKISRYWKFVLNLNAYIYDFGCVRGKEIGCIRQAQVIDVHWNCAVYIDSFEKVKAMMESLH